MAAEKTKPVNFVITEVEHKALRQHCLDKDVTIKEFFTELMNKELNKQKKGDK